MSKVMQIEHKTEEILRDVAKDIKQHQDFVTANPELTAEEIAEKKIQEQLVSDQDYGAAAGALFALYGTRLYATIDNLSAKQLRRLIKALCVYPLEDQFINTKVPLEKQAYILANKMIESRFLITLYTGFEEEEKRKKAAEECKAAEAAKTANPTNEEFLENANKVLEEHKETFDTLAKQEELEKGENNG